MNSFCEMDKKILPQYITGGGKGFVVYCSDEYRYNTELKFLINFMKINEIYKPYMNLMVKLRSRLMGVLETYHVHNVKELMRIFIQRYSSNILMDFCTNYNFVLTLEETLKYAKLYVEYYYNNYTDFFLQRASKDGYHVQVQLRGNGIFL